MINRHIRRLEYLLETGLKLSYTNKKCNKYFVNREDDVTVSPASDTNPIMATKKITHRLSGKKGNGSVARGCFFVEMFVRQSKLNGVNNKMKSVTINQSTE